MINKKILIFCFLILNIVSEAKDNPEYNISKIPEELKRNADMVVRQHSISFEVKDISNGIKKTKRVITLFNKDAEEYGLFYVMYDQFTKIKKLEVAVYNQSGGEIKRLKKSDYRDQSISGTDEVVDTRVIYADLSSYPYPYTIEIEYEEEYSALMFYPDFVPLRSTSVAVESSTYQILFPEELKPRHKEVSFEGFNISKFNIPGGLGWKMTGQKPIESEDKDPYFSEIIPQVLFAPTSFMIDGIEGNMSSWKEFSKWNYELNKDRDNLPEETKKELNALVEQYDNKVEKIKAIYEYLQQNTRYVSIQLGIGGWQTFPAEMVDRMGWGDCKALSNYTKAMLKSVGIDAYQALVKAGRNEPEIVKDFPNQTFNHVILYVPVENDTLWLECTSQENPFNYLGSFTSNRYVLPLTEGGNSLIRTPKIPNEQNIQSRKVTAKVFENGNATASISTHYSGLQYENNGIYYYVNRSKEDQKKWLLQNLDLTGYELTDFNHKIEKGNSPAIIQKIDINLLKFATVTGKRFFFNPNMMNKNEHVPRSKEDRMFPVRQYWGYTDIDEITYELPESLYPEYLPDPIEINSEFGEYKMEIIHEQGKLVYKRIIKMYEGEFPPESYKDYREFRKKIKSADNSKVVLMGKT